MLTTTIDARPRDPTLVKLNDKLGMHLNGPGYNRELNKTHVTNNYGQKVLPTRGKRA